MSKLRPPSREDYTVGWVCALPVELAAAREMLDEEHGALGHDANDNNIYTLGRVGEHNVVIACLPAGKTGTNSAAAVAVEMNSVFPSIRFDLMVGIGGGVPSVEANIRLGDVVVSSPHKQHGGVVQYDLGKATPSGFEQTGCINSPPRILLNAVSNVQANHWVGKSRFLEYLSNLTDLPAFARGSAGPDVLFAAEYDHEGGATCERCSKEKVVERQSRSQEIMVHYGTIASGNQVMRDGVARDRISLRLGGVLCFEMEAAGLMDSFPCLVIRGICDYADSHKNKRWQPYAAGTAAAYAKEVLSVIPAAEMAKSRTVDDIIQKNALDAILNRLSYAVEAPFNSYQRQQEPICFPGTRVDLLQEIYDWADRQDEHFIFWLNGLAGTGKSTIARTVARRCFEQDRLGASFFFSRGGGDVGHARKFVTTIALQLAKKSFSLHRYICEAVTEHSDVASQSLPDQWRQLVLRPLSKFHDSSCPSYILVVDALDECDDDNNIRMILHLLAEARSLKTVQLRVFMTSRPEIPIRHSIYELPKAEHQDFILHNIAPAIVDQDISKFLGHNLKIIRRECHLASNWPCEQDIGRLIQNANGLFIWMATACRFIREGKRFATKRLASILEGSSITITAPEKHLHQIYTTVLEHSVSLGYTDEEKEDLYAVLRHVLGSIVILLSPLSAHSLSRLVHIPKEDVDQTLEDLHAILNIPEDQTRPLRLHHPSFRDFLLNKDRCSDSNFQVDEKEAHRKLAKECIQLMSASLKQDVCGVDSPGKLVQNIESNRVQQCLPLEVQYACLYWVQHLQKSGAQLYDNDRFHQFLQEHFLHWLEALSWMRKMTEGIHEIISLEFIALKSGCSRLHEYIHDMKRFALYSRPGIEQAPLQVYFSALIFAPTMSTVRKQFEDRIPRWIRRLPGVRKDWSALLQTLEGHLSMVFAVVFSPDGKQLASGSVDNTVRLWDASTGAALQTLEGHSDLVSDVAFSPDGKQLASASPDGTVRLWDAGTGAALQTLEGHWDWVGAMAFSPDGKQLASAEGSGDAMLRLWDTGTGAALHTLKGHSKGIRAVAFSPDGKQLASGSGDNTVRLWDASTGAALQTLEGHSDLVSDVAFSPDGSHLASASWDGTVGLWDANTGAELQTLEGHSASIYVVAFSPDGRQLVSASDDRTVRLWDAVTGAARHTLKGHSKGIRAVAFSPNGKQLASATDDHAVPSDKTIRLWDAYTGAALQILEGHSGGVNAVAFSPDSKQLASASDDETIRLWDVDAGAALETLKGHSASIRAVAFSPNGKRLASASQDNKVKLWDAGTGAALQRLDGCSHWTFATEVVLAFSPDGKQLASVLYGENTVRLYDAGTGAVLRTLEGHRGEINVVAFSPNGKQLASGSVDNTVKLWDASTGAALRTLKHPSRPPPIFTMNIALAFSPDGKRLASALYDQTVRLWDTDTGAALHTLKGHSGKVMAVAFSPNGKQLASASGAPEKMVKLWDIDMGVALQTLKGHLKWVGAVAFSLDGRQLASASGDKTVRLWDARTGAALQIIKMNVVIRTLSFSDDGKSLSTDRGLWPIISLSSSIVPSRQGSSSDIFVDEQWVTWRTENMLWLPPERRALRAAVWGNFVALGSASGVLSIMEFAF